jgi:hypothetical protein
MVSAAAAAAAVMAAVAPTVAWAAGSAPQTASAVIRCAVLEVDLPNVQGQDCDTQQWGPLQNFTIQNRDSGPVFQCQTGWAEGTLWVSGQDCRQTP